LNVIGFDHVVLNVSDVERSVAFYCGELGLKPERLDEWRDKKVFFPSVRIDDHTLIDLLEVPRTGENANHICLVVDPTDFDAAKASGRFEVVDGPDIRWGARGDATSLYIKDSDGNVVELRYY
jgi:catechol 2,3-dioxygenase-like lactoylglutathione lyase family enzyme